MTKELNVPSEVIENVLNNKQVKFINKANIVHSKFYNYDKVVYINNKIKVIITCPKHGDFEQTPNNHLSGQGCPKCASCIKSLNVNEFIDKASIVHNNFYNYDKVVYINNKIKVKITCPIHGDFEQRPSSHLNENGCPECSKITSEIFINKASTIHNNFYSYDKVVYISSHKKVKIICPVHGDFEQTPNNHLRGQGCPKCKHSRSRNEIEICEFLQSHGIEFIHSDRTIINPYELDIVIPSKKIAIEFNGIYWHSDKKIRLKKKEKFKTADEYHNMKTLKCKSKGYNLIHIDENDWLNNKQKELNKILDFYHRV